MRPLPLGLLALACAAGRPLAAQQWNSPAALALAGRAIARRAGAAADTTLLDFRAQAHGFVFFLGAFGDGLAEPPRLIKADQLELEVYWKTPGASKQRIIGWRDQAELPTDMVYHQDHLGIVQNGFGSTIRLGDGDEVRDVPHPLSPGGPAAYDYATGDTITVALPGREVRVVALQVRPKDFRAPRIIGTAYLDTEHADLVRLSFNFTPSSYRDPRLEDVSVVLDNALYEDRWWLPRHQEIEIRRRAPLDLPARGIIRARWDVDRYVFNTGVGAAMFAGPEISAASKLERDAFPWTDSLPAAIQEVAEPVRRNDLAAVRDEVARIAGRRTLSGLPRAGLGIRGFSDLVRANRVQGLVLGSGLVWRGGAFEGRARSSYGLADRNVDATMSVRFTSGPGTVGASVYREVRDVGDGPVIAPLLNSLASQEFGDDYADYVRASGAQIAWRRPLGRRLEWQLAAARERVASLAVHTTPATGTFRPNAPLGGTTRGFVTLSLRRSSEGFAVRRDRSLDVSLQAGRRDGGGAYLRLFGSGHVLLPLGNTRLLARVQGGAASRWLVADRSFVLGGRGTLPGDGFREWGGRAAALTHLEWRVPTPFPSLALGPYARTPAIITLAPYVAAGWTGWPVPGTPWRATPGVRVTAGIGVEWLGVFRFEMGYGLQSHRVRAGFDVTRDFWSVL